MHKHGGNLARINTGGKVGAPAGNSNSSKSNRMWSETIRRAVLQADGKKLREIADMLIDLASKGDMAAIRELGDRLEGRSIQQIDATVDASVTIEVVRFADQTA